MLSIEPLVGRTIVKPLAQALTHLPTSASQPEAEEMHSRDRMEAKNTETTITQPSRLFRLPSELRNQIYSLVLTQPSPIRLPLGRSEAGKRDLLLTCRQIHSEATGIYYGNNAFIADCGSWFLNTDLICWLRGLGPKKRAMLKDVRLSLRQQRVFSPPCGVQDTTFFSTALMKRLEAADLGLGEGVVRVELGTVSSQLEYLTLPELEVRWRECQEKTTFAN